MPLKKKPRKKYAVAGPMEFPEDFVLTPEFETAFQLMENSPDHLFITGNAGTGKSTLLQYFKKTSKKNYVVLAPTGIAAINVGGSTIHSFFRFPIHLLGRDDVDFLADKQKLFASLQTIVIDEVSMVRADVMDAIDYSLRLNRKNPDEPFGGVRLIMIGDVHQLPPVVEPNLAGYFSEYYRSPYFFSANVFRDIPLKKLELHHIFRQSDASFIALLNRIRTNRITPEDLELLNRRCDPSIPDTGADMAITLTGTNALASEINQSRLDTLRGRDYFFDAEITGTFEEKSGPTDRRLRLKKGAQIMMVRNDPNKQFVNGSLGVIRKVTDKSIEVSFGGHTCEIEPSVWEKTEYEFNPDEQTIQPLVVGAFRQYPIKLAWAITVHKSQGKTFDNVIIDLGRGAFAHGQTYVALSRCRTLEGIRLRRPLRFSDIKVDEDVAEFQPHDI